jgi:hypothetical protein
MKQKYSIIFIKHIFSFFQEINDNDVYLKQEFKIDFVPSKGMIFESVDFKEEINNLSYDVVNGVFKVYSENKELCKSKYYISGNIKRDEIKLSEIINDYLSAGWEILKTWPEILE